MSLELTVCIEWGCEAPAEIVDWFELDSTDGPITHATTLCAGEKPHRLSVEAARLVAYGNSCADPRSAPKPEPMPPQ